MQTRLTYQETHTYHTSYYILFLFLSLESSAVHPDSSRHLLRSLKDERWEASG